MTTQRNYNDNYFIKCEIMLFGGDEEDSMVKTDPYVSRALIDIKDAAGVFQDSEHEEFCRFIDSNGETLWVVRIDIELAIEHLLKAKNSRIALNLFRQIT